MRPGVSVRAVGGPIKKQIFISVSQKITLLYEHHTWSPPPSHPLQLKCNMAVKNSIFPSKSLILLFTDFLFYVELGRKQIKSKKSTNLVKILEYRPELPIQRNICHSLNLETFLGVCLVNRIIQGFLSGVPPSESNILH